VLLIYIVEFDIGLVDDIGKTNKLYKKEIITIYICPRLILLNYAYNVRLNKHTYFNLFAGERLHDVEVTISQNNFALPTMCGFFGGPGDTGQTIYVFCTKGSRGRYVRLQIIGQIGSENMLTLCEVEVYILG